MCRTPSGARPKKNTARPSITLPNSRASYRTMAGMKSSEVKTVGPRDARPDFSSGIQPPRNLNPSGDFPKLEVHLLLPPGIIGGPPHPRFAPVKVVLPLWALLHIQQRLHAIRVPYEMPSSEPKPCNSLGYLS